MATYRSESDVREYVDNMLAEWLDDATAEDIESGVVSMVGEIRARVYCKDMLTKEHAMWLKDLIEYKFNATIRVLAKKDGNVSIGMACMLSMYDDIYQMLCRPGVYRVSV